MSNQFLFESELHDFSLVEGVQDSEKFFYIRGKFATIETLNNNKRIYPRALWEREVARYQSEIENGTVNTLMEWEHPQGRHKVDPKNAVAKITKLWIEGDFVMGEAVIFDNPQAETIKSMIRHGVKISVSSRASGSVGAGGVVSDFKLITFDIVTNPSDQNATMGGVYESDETEDSTERDDNMDQKLNENLIAILRAKNDEIRDLNEEIEILRSQRSTDGHTSAYGQERMYISESAMDYARNVAEDLVGAKNIEGESEDDTGNPTFTITFKAWKVLSKKIKGLKEVVGMKVLSSGVEGAYHFCWLVFSDPNGVKVTVNFEVAEDDINESDISAALADISDRLRALEIGVGKTDAPYGDDGYRGFRAIDDETDRYNEGEYTVRRYYDGYQDRFYNRHQDVSSTVVDNDPSGHYDSGEDHEPIIPKLISIGGRANEVGSVLDRDVSDNTDRPGSPSSVTSGNRFAQTGRELNESKNRFLSIPSHLL